MQTSPAGIDLIQHFEGCRLTAYRDASHVWTVGYGHTAGVRPDEQVTQAQADWLLSNDLAPIEAAVNRAVKVPLTQGQFDACVSLAFNIGPMAFQNSTLLERLNQRDYPGAADRFHCWIHAGSRVLAGLVLRRAAERDLFLGAKEKA